MDQANKEVIIKKKKKKENLRLETLILIQLE